MSDVTRVIHFDADAGADARAEIELQIRKAAAVGTDRHLVAPTLPGVINGGDLIVHLQYPNPAEWHRRKPAIEAVLTHSAVAKVYGVEYSAGTGGRVPHDHANALYRTLLLRVEPTASASAVERFERDLLSMPAHISSIRAWRLSRVTESTGPNEWTHVWEQEFAEHADVTGPYLNHPVHWAVVDRWFDPECTEVIVRDRVCHTFCDLDGAVLL